MKIHVYNKCLYLFFFRNEKFADVLLFTSNSDCASGIPAHKIILSSCSHVSNFSFHYSYILYFYSTIHYYYKKNQTHNK